MQMIKIFAKKFNYFSLRSLVFLLFFNDIRI